MRGRCSNRECWTPGSSPFWDGGGVVREWGVVTGHVPWKRHLREWTSLETRPLWIDPHSLPQMFPESPHLGLLMLHSAENTSPW